MTPDEITALPENRQLVFVSGLNCPPVLAERKPYWSCREMRGTFDPNPFHTASSPAVYSRRRKA